MIVVLADILNVRVGIADVQFVWWTNNASWFFKDRAWLPRIN